MSETTVAEGGEAPSSEVEAAAAVETPTTDFEAEATEYKNRFSGSQKKLTETLNTLKQRESEVEELRRYKAEQERASMTELERLTAERDEARSEAEAARSAATRADLARRFPQSFAVFGDEMPVNEDVLSKLEERLSAGTGEESEPEPAIDPNNPRKSTPAPTRDPMDAVDAWLKASFRGENF